MKLVEDTGGRIVARQGDVRDADSLAAALKAGLDSFGRLDIVVANAAIAPMTADNGWRDVIDVNLTGVYNTVAATAPIIIEQNEGGAIVLISSVAGLAGIATNASGSIGYAAAKHGIVGLMRAYANLLAPHSIRVNSVHPSGVDTPMINNEFTRAWINQAARRPESDERIADSGVGTRRHRQRRAVVGVRCRTLRHRRNTARRRRLLRQAMIKPASPKLSIGRRDRYRPVHIDAHRPGSARCARP